MSNPHKYRVLNGGNGLYARLADITEADGSVTAAILFVGTGSSKFDASEAEVVRAMCELHATRFSIIRWQGKFKVMEARS